MKSMLEHLRLPDWIYKYTAAALLILIPLYPKFPLVSISGTFVAIRFEDLLLAFAGILVVAAYLPKYREFIKNDINKSILLYLSVAALSLISAVLITQTIDPKIGLLHWARRVEYFIPFFLAMEIVSRKINISFYFKILLIVVFIAFVYGIGQKNFDWPIVITQNEEYSRGVALRYVPGGHINSTFAGHYDLATFLVMTLPIIVVSFFTIKGRMSKFIIILAYISGMWLLVNTASRISLMAYFTAVSASLFLIKKYKAIIPIIIISLVFAVFSSNLLGRYSRLLEVARERLGGIYINANQVLATDDYSLRRTDKPVATPTPTPVLEDRSTNIRLNVEWPRAMRAFYKNPLLGTGYSSITLATDNDYLRALGETGILGLTAFLLIFLRVIIRFLKSLPFERLYSGENLALVAGMFGSLSGLFINAMFIDIFEASKFATIFWFLTGLSIKLVGNRKYA